MKEWIVSAESTDDLYCGYFELDKDLIRCKDCKFYDGRSCHNKWYGDGFGWYAPPVKTEEGYCDWAERREEDERMDTMQ